MLFSLGLARNGGGRGEGLPGWFGAFFPPRLPGGVRACQDGLEHFFPRLTEGVGSLKLFGQGPYRTNTFQIGPSLKIR